MALPLHDILVIELKITPCVQEWIRGPFNFHETKQNHNPLHRACSFTSFYRIILKITSACTNQSGTIKFSKKTKLQLAFGASKLHYFITLESNRFQHAQTDT